MKTKELLLFAILFLCLQVSTVSAIDPIVENADAIWKSNLDTAPANLTDTASTTLPRPLIEYPNTVLNFELRECPEDLTDNANKVLPRPLIEYSNTAFSFVLEESPGKLINVIRKALPRPLVEHSNTVSSKSLIFPKELINDTTSPIITNVTITNITDSSATIKWDTDEIADSVVKYGGVSGNYTETENDLLFVRNHTIALAKLSSGTTYYFVVNSMDRSGNSAKSSECCFTTGSEWIEKAGHPPVAVLKYKPYCPVVNQTITFNASSSYDPDDPSGYYYNITSYDWDFGDGNTTTGKIVNHSYWLTLI